MANRVLVLRHLAGMRPTPIQPADPADVATMKNLLNVNDHFLDAGPAGTVLRFMAPLLVSQPDRQVTLTGSARMLERPIGPLVEALRQIGAEVNYAGKSGFPPLHIVGRTLSGGKVTIQADVSSQFISALLMLGPTLPRGLKIELKGTRVSKPYTDMTIGLMRAFGAQVQETPDGYAVEPTGYLPTEVGIEPDWSAASFAYALVALRPRSELILPGLQSHSLQGDAVLPTFFKALGVETEFMTHGAKISNSGTIQAGVHFDLSPYPDLAQAIMAACAALGLRCTLSGIGNLRLKETDRIHAMQTELAKAGVEVIEKLSGTITVSGKARCGCQSFDTYHDHRMAMSLAPLALVCTEVKIENPMVVNKSFPGFWEQLLQLGFQIA